MIKIEDLQEEVLNELLLDLRVPTPDRPAKADDESGSGPVHAYDKRYGPNGWEAKRKQNKAPEAEAPIQEEVLNELFGITNFSSTLQGIFGGSVRHASELKKYATAEDSRARESGKIFVPKKDIDRRTNPANRIQQASGFLSDKSLNDADLSTYLRNAMVKGADASKEEASALRKTGYKAGPPTYNRYGEVGLRKYVSRIADYTPKYDAATKEAINKRRDTYANKSYASIRETQYQTIRRLLNEMRLEEWRITPQLSKDSDYVHNAFKRTADARDAEKNTVGGNPRKVRALSTALDFLGRVADAHYEKDGAMRDARDSASWGTEADNERYPNSPVIKNSSVEESYVYDADLINRIVEELLEAFMYDPKHHKNPEGTPGPLTGNKYDTLQRALDAGHQLTPYGTQMGDWNHIIVAPEEAKKVEAPQPPAEADPEDQINPMSKIQPVAAPVK